MADRSDEVDGVQLCPCGLSRDGHRRQRPVYVTDSEVHSVRPGDTGGAGGSAEPRRRADPGLPDPLHSTRGIPDEELHADEPSCCDHSCASDCNEDTEQYPDWLLNELDAIPVPVWKPLPDYYRSGGTYGFDPPVAISDTVPGRCHCGAEAHPGHACGDTSAASSPYVDPRPCQHCRRSTGFINDLESAVVYHLSPGHIHAYEEHDNGRWLEV